MNEKPLKDELRKHIKIVQDSHAGEPLHLKDSEPYRRVNPDIDKHVFSKTRKQYESHLDRINDVCDTPESDDNALSDSLLEVNRLAAPLEGPVLTGLKGFLKKILSRIIRFALSEDLVRAGNYDSAATRALNELNNQVRQLQSVQAAFNSEVAQYGQSVVPVIDEKLERVYRETVDLLNQRMDILFEGLDRRNTILSEWLNNLGGQLEQLESECRRGLALQHRKLETLTVPADSQPLATGTLPPVDAGGLGDFAYYLFESRYRGSEASISKLQSLYLPYFQGHPPVLDIGCGRGEFLELLQSKNIAATGIDINGDMIEICREKKLDVIQVDALSYLASCSPQHFGGIFAAQMVEHLPVHQVSQWLKSVYRALKPGGVIVFESVNTASPHAVFNHYYRDPTHQQPIHPETYRFMTEIAGFENISLTYLDRDPQGLQDLVLSSEISEELQKPLSKLVETVRRLNEFVYAPADFAIRARKPDPEE